MTQRNMHKPDGLLRRTVVYLHDMTIRGSNWRFDGHQPGMFSPCR